MAGESLTMKWRHIYPVGDLVEHDTHKKECWCHPDIFWDECIIVHSSMDGREHDELDGPGTGPRLEPRLD